MSNHITSEKSENIGGARLKPPANQTGPTYQSTLTRDEIKNRLANYLPVDNVNDVPYNTHVRYFLQNDEGKWLFRLGGFIKNKKNPDYIILSNSPGPSGSTWTVLRSRAKFYKRKPPTTGWNPSGPIRKNAKKPADTGVAVGPVAGPASGPAKTEGVVGRENRALEEINKQYQVALEEQQQEIQILLRQLAELSEAKKRD